MIQTEEYTVITQNIQTLEIFKHPKTSLLFQPV